MTSQSGNTYSSHATARPDGSYSVFFSTTSSYEAGNWYITMTNVGRSTVVYFYMEPSGWKDEIVKVTTNLSNAVSVSMVDSSGSILATTPISGGTATLDIGKYHLPLTANIVTYNSTNAPVVSTSRPVYIYGGNLCFRWPLIISVILFPF